MKFDCSNKFALCYYGQVNSLRLKSSVSSKWEVNTCGADINFAGDGTFTNLIVLRIAAEHPILAIPTTPWKSELWNTDTPVAACASFYIRHQDKHPKIWPTVAQMFQHISHISL